MTRKPWLIPFLLALALGLLSTQKAIAQNIEALLTTAQSQEQAGNFSDAISTYSKAATSYQIKNQPQQARKINDHTINLCLDIGNTHALKYLYTDNGLISVDLQEYEKALDYFAKCLQINRKQNKQNDIAATLLNIANVHIDCNQTQKALEAALEANSLARQTNNVKLLRNSYSLLTNIYNSLGETQKSAEAFAMYTTFTRKIQRQDAAKNEEKAKQKVHEAQNQLSQIRTQKAQTEKELVQKQQALKTVSDSLEKVEQISREQQMQLDLQQVTIRNQKLVHYIFFVIILAFVGISASIGYWYVQKKRKNILLAKQNLEIAAQRDTIEAKSQQLTLAMAKIAKQNRDITSSINYAQRIQEALLPNFSDLVHLIRDFFILFRPREIVSGDFYWVSSYTGDKTKANKLMYSSNIPPDQTGILISAVDCTGHGVPGAFMSMIGLNLLDSIARAGIVKPDLILNEMHRSVRHLLKQDNTDSRDGMDMCICNVASDGQTITFAGAKNPVYYITNGVLHEIKGDPMPIGGIQKEERRVFTAHTIKISAPTRFYIFSDGYVDQFGGELGRRLTSKTFKELLVKNHKLPMIQQQEILEHELEQWQGVEYKAVDDVLVIGFSLSGKPLNI